VVCLGPGGIVTAHGGFPSYVGGSADILKDADGKPLGSTIWNTGSSKGEGLIHYPMVNPVSKKVERKSSYIQKFGEDVCVVGAYNPL
jgi:cytochrome c